MKTTKFFLLGLAALAMTACNKEENGIQPVTGDATISFVIKTGTPNQRDEEEPPYENVLEDDAKITSLIAMVYAGQTQEAIKEAKSEGDAGITEVKDIPCKPGPNRTLVIVANSSDEVGTFKDLSLAQLEAKTIELTKDNQEGKYLVMTGKSAPFEIKKGKNFYGYTQVEGGADNLIEENHPLAITRVHAGMTIKTVKVTFSANYAKKYSFKPENIAGLICKKTSKIFGKPLVTTDNYYLSGLKDTFDGIYNPENYTGNQKWLKKEYAKHAGFFILESDYTKAPIYPTILCVYGKLLDDNGDPLKETALEEAIAAHYCDADGITYYPVLVNYKHDNYTYVGEGEGGKNMIERNNHYQISLTVTAPGTNNPEGPIFDKATLNVKCEVTPWVIVGQNVTW